MLQLAAKSNLAYRSITFLDLNVIAMFKMDQELIQFLLINQLIHLRKRAKFQLLERK